MVSYTDLTPVARPMLTELRDVGPQHREQLQDALMFDDADYEEALGELTAHGFVERTDDYVLRATDVGIRVVDTEREEQGD